MVATTSARSNSLAKNTRSAYPLGPLGRAGARQSMGTWGLPPIAQLAEAADLKSAQSGFESLWGDHAGAPLLPEARVNPTVGQNGGVYGSGARGAKRPGNGLLGLQAGAQLGELRGERCREAIAELGEELLGQL